MNSPYFTGAAPNFGPPSGMAGLISQDRSSQMDTSGFKQFADVAEKFKRQQDAGKAADYFVKASEQPDGTNPVLDSMGIHPEQWKTLGAGDKTNAVQGVVQAQAQKNVMQQYADIAAQQHERDAQAKSMSDTGDFLRSYANDLPQGTEDTPQNRLANALHSLRPGADIGRVFPQAMNSLEKFATIGANANNATAFDEDPVTGRRFARLGKTIQASGVDTSKASPPDAPPGYSTVADGKGGWKYLKMNPGTMTDEEKAKVTAGYEKNIDDLLKSYAFAKGDPEMETLFKDRIAAHKDAIKVINQAKPAAAVDASKVMFKSAEEVKAAVAAGTLAKDAALKILQNQFGMK
jgi:hypothetical protein